MIAQTDTVESYRLDDLMKGVVGQSHPLPREVLRGWWVTSRMEYLPDALVHTVLPLLLVLRHEPLSGSLLVLTLAGLVMWLLGHWIGCSLNCLSDYPVDRLDTGRKARLATAIDRAGTRSLLIVNLVEIVFATALSTWLVAQYGKPLLLVLWLLGLGVAYLYSFEPVRFKRRNLLNPAALLIIIYATPLFFVYHLLSPVWDPFDVAVLAFYCLQMIPMFLVSDVCDYEQDRAKNVRNPCVTYGRVAITWITTGIYIVACLGALGLFLGEGKSPTFGRIGLIVLGGLAYLWVVSQFLTLTRLSRAIDAAHGEDATRLQVRALKQFFKMPAWLFTTSIGMLLLALADAF